MGLQVDIAHFHKHTTSKTTPSEQHNNNKKTSQGKGGPLDRWYIVDNKF